MKIIIKYLLSNIKEKKLRSILVVFAIILSSALFFASNAISTTTKEAYIKRMRKYYGSADIEVRVKPKTGEYFFRDHQLDRFKDEIDAYMGILYANGQIVEKEEINLTLYSTDLKDLQIINPIALPKEFDFDSFSGPKIIINQEIANTLNKKAGDYLDLKAYDIVKRLKIVAVIPPSGPLTVDAWSKNAIIPMDYLSRIYDSNGRISNVFIKAKKHEKRFDLINKINEAFPRLTASETIREQDIERWTSSISTPFLIMVTLILCTSVFIIFTSFQVMCKERLPTIGTFRSIGATRWNTSWLFLLEAFLYGLVGGLIGLALGFAILYGMTWISLPEFLKDKGIEIFYTNEQLISSFILAILISIGSAFIPIFKVSRIPPKDVILNTVTHKAMSKKKRFIIGSVLLILGAIAPFILPKGFLLPGTVISMIMLVTSVVQLSPFLSSLYLKIIAHAYTLFFGNMGLISAKNLKDSPVMQHNISLLAIGISSLLMIYTISGSINVHINNLYSKAHFDIEYRSWGLDKNLENRIKRIDGVQESYGHYSLWQTPIDGTQEKVWSLDGIDTQRYYDFWRYTIPMRKQLFDALDRDRNMIVGLNLKRQLNWKIGDIIPLAMPKGVRNYRIIGFFETMWSNGNHALISQKYFKHDSGRKNYSRLYIRTNKNPDKMVEVLKKEFSRRRPRVNTMKKLAADNLKYNNQLMTLLQTFSIMALVIGIIGVINNFILGFIERKKSLALYRTLGMSQNQMIHMTFIEAFTQGVIGSLAGLIAGTLMLFVIPQLMMAMEMYLTIHFSIILFIIFILSGIVICLLASVSPALRAKNLNTLEALKYE